MSSNLIEVTRDLYTGALINQVGFKMPLFTRLVERKKIREGGLRIAENLEIAQSDSLVQEYGEKEGLQGGSQEIYDTASFNVAQMQVPLQKTKLEHIMNQPKTDAQLQNIAKDTARSALTGIQIRMMKRFYGCATDQEKGTYLTLCQGIFSALNPSTTYATIDRSSGNTYWQPADYANTHTSYNLNRDLLRKWIDDAIYYAESPGAIIVLMGNTLYRRMKAEFEAHGTYDLKQGATVEKQGFNSMYLDGTEIIGDPYLDTMTQSTVSHASGTGTDRYAGLMGYNSNGYDGSNVVCILNLDSWSLRYVKNPMNNGIVENSGLTYLSDFFDQSKVVGGGAYWLARAFTDCNLCCNQPNINMARMNCN